MKIRFSGIARITRFAGVFRTPGEVAVLHAADAREAIRRGLAVPLGDTALNAPPAHTALRGRATPELQRPDFPPAAEHAHGLDHLHPYRETTVIIPCFRSHAHVAPLLAGMAAERDAVALVSDGDGLYAVRAPQIALSENTGFAHACNVGAEYTRSKYLCFLNADIRVTPDWLDAMIDEIESDPQIAAVGNRQLDADGRIHSCGSVWSWKTNHFEHLLRGQSPDKQKLWCEPRDVDMITGSCLLVRRSAFEQVGGFDERYRLGYWEDADLCMKLRNAGYRIRFTPESQIIHHVGHSGRSQHRYYSHNADLCRSRWVETGLVDKFARQRGERTHGGNVVACMIALNEEEYIQAAIEGVAPLADRIIIVEGGTDYAEAAKLCGPDRRSADGTLDAIEEAMDHCPGKIELIQGKWPDKADQRNAYAQRLEPGDIMLLLDADEVFYDAGLWRLSYLMHKHDVIMPGFDLFWNNFQTVATGMWNEFSQVKVVRWREGYHYRDHNCPCDAHGRLVTSLRKAYTTPEGLYAHYAWVKPLEKLRQKAAYYEHQPGAAQRMRPSYIDTVFLPWRKNPKEIESRFGTHPFGGGETAPFTGVHPEPIRRRLKSREFFWVDG